MYANPFESQLERLARTLTEQFGVQVVCQGDNAWTDGRQITLPSLHEPLNENLERMTLGFLDHELAHVAFSDFDVAEGFAKSTDQGPQSQESQSGKNSGSGSPEANPDVNQQTVNTRPQESGSQNNSQASGPNASGNQSTDQRPEADVKQPNVDNSSAGAQSEQSPSRKKRRRGQNTPASTQGEEPSVQPAAGQAVSHNSGSLISQALAEAIAEGVAQSSQSAEYRVFTKQYDHIDTLPAATDSDIQALLSTGNDVVRRLRRGLANALRSSEKRWWRDDQVRGSLSPRTLYRLCTDRRQLDVFRVRSTVQGRSTAVCVVLDASGSMTHRKMEVARQAMRVLLEALSDLKIATEAFTFTTGDLFNLGEAGKASGMPVQQLHDRFSRFGNLEIGLIKRFEEPAKAALRRLPTIRGSGLTPLGEAMQIGALHLSSRPESRKILVVLTDGKAGCESGDGSAVNHAQHIAGLCGKAGIELIGVGIQDDSLRAIVADTIVIFALEELPAQLCKLLGRTLQMGLKHVG